jgi:soluble lytic murein transglycosylase
MIQSSFKLLLTAILVTTVLSISCSAQLTEEQALANLRQMTADGKLPPEGVVADIESRFAGKRTGALAKLLHARIRFENQDYAGAAALLNSDVFKTKTKVGDYALWLRGKALQAAANHAEAMNVLKAVIDQFPDSIRTRDAKLMWATSAIAAGRAVEVPPMLVQLSEKNDGDALLMTAKAYEAQGSQADAVRYFRRAYFLSFGTTAAKEAEAKLVSLAQNLTPSSGEEAVGKAEKLFRSKSYAEASRAYDLAFADFTSSTNNSVILNRLVTNANLQRMDAAKSDFTVIPSAAPEKEDAYRQLILGYAKAKQWPQAHQTAEEMRKAFPNGPLVAKTFIDAGLAARDQKNKTEEGYFLNAAVAAFPNAVEVASAQFEAAWYQHENGNFAMSSQGFIDHLARYADKDNSNRGKAGYWAARDSQRAGKLAEACALYDGVLYRYGANWYGYLALDRLSAMKAAGQCNSPSSDPNVARAIANLKKVTVAAETAGPREIERADKSEELSTIGLFDWAIDELNEAKKTADKSPRINLSLARHYRWKGDNTAALVAMQKSYPDYAQMFPEEMGREEWSLFYPLNYWSDIKKWSAARGLDKYQVAGFIRQETIFAPRAKSGANAYGLMQLLLPTATSVARRYASTMPSSAEDLYNPSLNIELGTGYLKDQFAKFGRVEFVAVAYNAGPGRVPQWRASLPAEMDEFVEEIPFKETKQYVQGIIRNSAQYRRLYDENGNFKPNVGTRPLRGEMDTLPREQFTADNPEVTITDDSE